MSEWLTFSWHAEPQSWKAHTDGTLEIVTAKGGDFWRETQYGFIHDDGHAFLRDAPAEFTASVRVRGGYRELYDQAGLMLRANAQHWCKVGVEYVGRQQWSAVVTHEKSDWSVQPADDHAEITFRMIRRDDALILHARANANSRWTLLRVAPFPPELSARVGVVACSPLREGFRVTFEDFQLTDVDRRPLHELSDP
ncbi:DUF1349 domain-containing protein [Deinococcus arenicola]|uniref:DUF1349 domain-containing protein n=1 Tax=Deinococcus arenicola TaxID=2994950 RepID=A0ABU4DMW9_9DEIO|nr:DUF1349 domain-containing protein [Deinococcus sp. ZS9-10]MDV6373776.1 DUF1349 domain-containing protein [Deinococcus sp. ZS9-10]